MHQKGETMQITKKKQVCLIVVLEILTLVAMCFLKEHKMIRRDIQMERS